MFAGVRLVGGGGAFVGFSVGVFEYRVILGRARQQTLKTTDEEADQARKAEMYLRVGVGIGALVLAAFGYWFAETMFL